MSKKAVVVISFGTTIQKAWDAAITPTEKVIEAGFLNCHFERAITSRFIRRKLEERGVKVCFPEEVLERLLCEGYDQILMQPLHILPGFEYEKIKAAIKEATQKVESRGIKIILGRPLLGEAYDENSSKEELLETIRALQTQLKNHTGEERVILIGHGTEHPANQLYTRLEEVLKEHEMPIQVATLEEGPDEMLQRLHQESRKVKSKKLLLMPFLFVAGDHVRNDLMGEKESSWKNVLTKAGYDVRVYEKGLGENEAFRNLYLKRLKDAQREANENV